MRPTRQQRRAAERAARKPKMADPGQTKIVTYWNGEPTPCRRVIVRVGTEGPPAAWWRGLEGTQRAAVEVAHFPGPIYLDDVTGSGWAKVTTGRGSPRYGHRSLPDDSVVVGLAE